MERRALAVYWIKMPVYVPEIGFEIAVDSISSLGGGEIKIDITQQPKTMATDLVRLPHNFSSSVREMFSQQLGTS